MLLLSFISPLASQSDISQPLVILAIALGFAGIAILILFSRGRI